jgi:hypothetical protein
MHQGYTCSASACPLVTLRRSFSESGCCPVPAAVCQQSVSTPALRRHAQQDMAATRQCRRAGTMWCRAWCRRAVCGGAHSLHTAEATGSSPSTRVARHARWTRPVVAARSACPGRPRWRRPGCRGAAWFTTGNDVHGPSERHGSRCGHFKPGTLPGQAWSRDPPEPVAAPNRPFAVITPSRRSSSESGRAVQRPIPAGSRRNDPG